MKPLWLVLIGEFRGCGTDSATLFSDRTLAEAKATLWATMPEYSGKRVYLLQASTVASCIAGKVLWTDETLKEKEHDA